MNSFSTLMVETIDCATRSGLPHSGQDKIPRLFHVLSTFSLCFFFSIKITFIQTLPGNIDHGASSLPYQSRPSRKGVGSPGQGTPCLPSPYLVQTARTVVSSQNTRFTKVIIQQESKSGGLNKFELFKLLLNLAKWEWQPHNVLWIFPKSPNISVPRSFYQKQWVRSYLLDEFTLAELLLPTQDIDAYNDAYKRAALL